MAALLEKHPQVRHFRIADARGKPLGRSFRVKLWPSLIFMRDGVTRLQVARPDVVQMQAGFQAIAG